MREFMVHAADGCNFVFGEATIAGIHAAMKAGRLTARQ